MKCHKEPELLEYLLGNSQYDSVIVEEGAHYSGQEQEETIEAEDVDKRISDSLMNSFENSNQHTNVLIEEEKSEQHTDVLPKEKEALRLCVFYFNNYFVSASLVAYAGENLAQMNNQVKTVEEDSMENSNPWNRYVQSLERMLESQDSMQKEIIMKEGKDERVTVRIRQLQREDNKEHFEELVDNSKNLKQRERGNNKWQNMDQLMDMLEMEIEALWQLMMKQSIWRRLTATGRMINQNLKLIEKERKMKHKTTDIQ